MNGFVQCGAHWCVAIYFHALSNTTFTKISLVSIIGTKYHYNVSFRCLQKALTLRIRGSLNLSPDITMQRVLVVGVSLLVWDLPSKIPPSLSPKVCQVFHRRRSHQDRAQNDRKLHSQLQHNRTLVHLRIKF